MFSKLYKYLSCFTFIALSSSALALTPGVEKLVQFETKANAASVRSSQTIMLPHIEIPLELVGVDFAKRIDTRIADSLVINKEGKKFVRWILNPEDTLWHIELIEHLKKNGISAQVIHHFKGYQTASRSYIAEDPINGAQFSVKSSTNITGGSWRDKKQPIGEAIDGRLLSDFFYDQSKKRPFENFIIMDEPAILKVDAIDQAVVIRDLGALKKRDNNRFYLPGFSALHETIGQEIAKKNGFDDAHAFWTKNYIEVAGRALGELAARTGVQFDSPHSQNFLIELDSQMKPTGLLVLRDMSDLYIDVNFLKALLGDDNKIVSEFTQEGNKLQSIAAGFGPLHGNSYPSWITREQYKEWKNIFFNEFEKTFEKISGYSLDSIKASKSLNGDYFGASYKLSGQSEFKEFFKNMKARGVVLNSNDKLFCKKLIASGE